MLVFNFSNKLAFPPDVKIGHSDTLNEVNHAKILGLIIQSNLKWNLNTEFIYNKAAEKLWLLRRLRQFKLEVETLTDFYTKEIRVILEYAAPVWYSGITLKQSKTIEKIQKWAVSIILNNWTLSYTVKCTLLGIEPLYLRRKSLALNFSLRTVKNPKHKDFFQPKHRPYNTRQATVVTYEENQVRSTRFKNSPLVALRRDLNEYNHNKTRSARDGFS